MFFKADEYFDFIVINLKNTILHNYVVQMSEEYLFRIISGTVGNSFLIPSHNLFSDSSISS